MGSWFPFSASLFTIGLMTMMVFFAISSGGTASSKSNTRIRVNIRTLNLIGSVSKFATYHMLQICLLDQSETVANTTSRPTRESENVTPHSWNAVNRLWQIIPTLGLKLRSIFAPYFFCLIDRRDGNYDLITSSNPAQHGNERNLAFTDDLDIVHLLD